MAQQTPAFPATGTGSTNQVLNATGQTQYVTVTGGTVTHIYVGASGSGTSVATSTGYTATVLPGQYISVAYSGSPAWAWSPFTPAVPATGTAVTNTTGQWMSVAVTGGTITTIASAPPATAPPQVVTPAIPATTVQAASSYAFPVAVTVTGGTTTHVAVNGSDQFTSISTAVTAVIPAGGNIAITYSVAPTSWAWSALLAGAALSSGLTASVPYYIPVMPGGTLTLTYTGSPVWTWVNYPWLASAANAAGTPYAPNDTVTATGQAGFSEVMALPYPAHAEGGLAGLGAAVSN